MYFRRRRGRELALPPPPAGLAKVADLVHHADRFGIVTGPRLAQVVSAAANPPPQSVPAYRAGEAHAERGRISPQRCESALGSASVVPVMSATLPLSRRKRTSARYFIMSGTCQKQKFTSGRGTRSYFATRCSAWWPLGISPEPLGQW
jgi:hypothetical protein